MDKREWGKMKIRKARKEDLKEISNILMKESSKKPYSQNWTTKKSLKKITNAYKEDDILIVLIKKEIAGFIIASIHPNNKSKSYIDELWIKSNYQGRGLGKSFVKEIEKKYKNKGVKIIRVVSNRKAGAYEFYKKLNYGDSKELAFMEKKLK